MFWAVTLVSGCAGWLLSCPLSPSLPPPRSSHARRILAAYDLPSSTRSHQLSHSDIAKAVSSTSDKEALTHLSDVELIQDAHDPREFEIVFVSTLQGLSAGGQRE